MKLFFFLLTLLTINISSNFAQQNPILSNRNPLVGRFSLSQPFNVQKKEMDIFAGILEKDNTAVGFVIISTSKGYKSKIALYKQRIKNYLVKTRGINSDRLKLYSGWFSEAATVELYVIPK